MKYQHVVYLLALGTLGYLMLSDPRCNRGCKSVAEHLVSHAIDDLLGGLLAA
jgi:hypothetical protein